MTDDVRKNVAAMAASMMKGYERKPEDTEKLLAALRDALYARPNERLGQLLMNSTDTRSGADMFNIYDESMISYLREYAARSGAEDKK